MSAREGIQLDQRFSPPTLFIVIGAHLRTGRPTLTEFFLLLFPRLNLGKKTNNKHSVDKHPPDICRAAIDVDVFVVELPGVYVFVFNNNTTPTNRFVSLPVLSCFPLPPEERRSTEVRSIACDDVPVCVASLLFVCFNSIGSSQVLEVFVLFDGKGLNQKFTAPIPLPNFLFERVKESVPAVRSQFLRLCLTLGYTDSQINAHVRDSSMRKQLQRLEQHDPSQS